MADAPVEGDRLELTVIVVTHNSGRLLESHLAALPAAAGGSRLEVVIVDSGSSDDSLGTAARLLPGVLTIDLGANLGYAAGINAGVAGRALHGPVVVLNPDTLPAPGALRALAAGLATPGTGICVPRLVNDEGSTQHCLRRRPTVLRALGEAVLGGRSGRFDALGETIHDPARYEVSSEVDWAGGAALAMSVDCLRAVGPWDESFFLYSEETDFQLRAAEVGFSTRYVPEAVVMHRGGDSHVSPMLFSLLTVNRVRLQRRLSGPVRNAGYRSAVALNCGLRTCTGSRPHRAALKSLFRSADQVVAEVRAEYSR
jgi:N-acetylglucosaminyl-diphospho-decaprenol L-rhamnosyltransferase